MLNYIADAEALYDDTGALTERFFAIICQRLAVEIAEHASVIGATAAAHGNYFFSVQSVPMNDYCFCPNDFNWKDYCEGMPRTYVAFDSFAEAVAYVAALANEVDQHPEALEEARGELDAI